MNSALGRRQPARAGDITHQAPVFSATIGRLLGSNPFEGLRWRCTSFVTALFPPHPTFPLLRSTSEVRLYGARHSFLLAMIVRRFEPTPL